MILTLIRDMPLWNTNPPDINPLNITNLVSWYGSNSANYNGNILTSWSDKSRHGNNITPLSKPYLAYNTTNIGIGTGVHVAEGFALDSDGNIFVLDGGNYGSNVVQMYPKSNGIYYGISMSSNTWNVVVGVRSAGGGGGTITPNYDGDNKLANTANLCSPYGIAIDSQNNIFIADQGNNRVRMVPKNTGNYFGQSMTSNFIYTVAGNGTAGWSNDGTFASNARINKPYGLAVDSANNLFIADTNNYRIAVVSRADTTLFGKPMLSNRIYTIVGCNGNGSSANGTLASAARLNSIIRSIAFDSLNNLFISDYFANKIIMVPAITGNYYNISMNSNSLYAIAGTGGTSGGEGFNYAYNGVLACNALLKSPGGLFFDKYDNLLFADIEDNIISIIPRQNTNYFGSNLLSNYLYVIAGSNIGYLSTAPLLYPTGVVIDNDSNMTVSSASGNQITTASRKLQYLNTSVNNYVFSNIYCYNTAQIEFQRQSTGATLFAVWKSLGFSSTPNIQNIVTIFTDVLSNATNTKSNFSLSIYNTNSSNFFINTNDLAYNSTRSNSLNIASYNTSPNILTAICFNSQQSDGSYSKGYINGAINSSNSNVITITNDRNYLNIFIGDDLSYTDINNKTHSGGSYIYDILIYNKVLNPSEISKVHRYLQATYNTSALVNGGNFQY